MYLCLTQKENTDKHRQWTPFVLHIFIIKKHYFLQDSLWKFTKKLESKGSFVMKGTHLRGERQVR